MRRFGLKHLCTQYKRQVQEQLYPLEALRQQWGGRPRDGLLWRDRKSWIVPITRPSHSEKSSVISSGPRTRPVVGLHALWETRSKRSPKMPKVSTKSPFVRIRVKQMGAGILFPRRYDHRGCMPNTQATTPLH